jgi:CubicO group peptidase (beta-lactamase class C family)
MTIRSSLGLTLLLTVGALGACDDSNEPAEHGHDDGGAHDGDEHGDGDAAKIDFARFDEALEKAIAAHNAGEGTKIMGASAAVVHEKRGVLHTKGYGDYAADRLYLIASSSKILSVGVLMRLADQGKLDIDAPLGDYLSAWGDTEVSKVTVAQLVSNSSGMPSLSEVVGAATDTSSPYVADLCQYTDQGKLQDCGKLLYATEPPRKPATEFAYGGSQWQLAGAVAEVVSGKSWADLIDETYRTPCDVPTLGFSNQFGKTSGFDYPAFFQAKKENLPVTENPSIEGGAFVTVGDYAKLLVMHLRGGKCGDTQVLSEAAVARMQEDTVAAYGGSTGNAGAPGYGLGFWINEAGEFVTDPGAYGSFPLLDQKRRYGVFIAIEVSSEVGGKLGTAVKPSLDAIFDEAKIE